MGVILSGENAKDIVVFMHRLAVIPPLDRIPPAGVGVSVLAFDGEGGGEGGVRVVAVLHKSALLAHDRWHVILGEPHHVRVGGVVHQVFGCLFGLFHSPLVCFALPTYDCQGGSPLCDRRDSAGG